MPITSIARDTPNNVSIVRITCTDTLAEIATANYILAQTPTINALNKGVWQWFNGDTLLFDSADGNAFFQFTDFTFTSLVLIASSTDGTVSPGLIGQIGIYAASGTVISGSSTIPPLVQAVAANFNNGVGATSSTFINGNMQFISPSVVIAPTGNVRFVSNSGSNVTGNGSITNPWQTIAFALSQITTAASNNPFQINCLTGNYVETNLVFKPWVYINGLNSNLSIPGTITQHASFSSGGTVIFENFNQFICLSGMTLDFSSAGFNGVEVRIQNINSYFANPTEITGSGTSTVAYINNIFSNVSPSFINCRFYFLNSSTFNISHDINTIAGFYTSYISNTNFNDNFTVTGDGTPGASIYILGSNIPNAINATGANIGLFLSSDSVLNGYLPTLAGGSTATYINSSNGVHANYTPVNYSPDASGGTIPITSVAAHLHGIDNALGVVGDALNIVYVSYSNGVDSPGAGTIGSPFKTVGYAETQITTATTATPFLIYCFPDSYTETTLSLKPNISINGNYSDFTFSGAITADATWSGGGNVFINNINTLIVTGGVTLDISSAGALVSIIDFSNVITWVGTSSFTGGSNANIYLNNISTSSTFTLTNCNGVAKNNSFSSVNLVSNSGFRRYSFSSSPITIFSSTSSGGGSWDNIIYGSEIGSLTATGSGTTVTLNPDSVVSNPNIVSSAVIRYSNKSSINIWADATTSRTMIAGTGYFANDAAAVTLTIPSSGSTGDVFAIQGMGAGGWVLQANTGQVVNVGNSPTTTAGSVSSTNQWDAIEIVRTPTAGVFTTRSLVGTLTIA